MWDIDLKKAFDTVNHIILLVRLEHYGIRGTAQEWFKSYLSNRKQYVSINGSNSSYVNVTCGVPQGFVLGPLLFLIYSSDLPLASSKLAFYLFADDTNIYYETESLATMQSVVNKELKKLNCGLMLISCHSILRKTNFINFKSLRQSSPETAGIKIGNSFVKQTFHVKFLGALLDENISWMYPLFELSKKMARTCGMFFRARHF